MKLAHRIFNAIFPSRPFPQPNGVIDEMRRDYIEQERQREIRTAEHLEQFNEENPT